MNNKLLVFIKNGVSFDPHCGEISYYYPIIMLGDYDLDIDDDIRIECVKWG